MITTLRKVTHIAFFALCASLLSFSIAHASSLSLSVTPPLFQLSIKPGDVWQSSIRVVNPNDFAITVYPEVVNFSPEGEGGNGRFIPILHSDETKLTLAEWIDISEGTYVLEPGRSQDISFIVDVPKDAAPGGHFAAILISTEPPKTTNEPLALATSQTVTSLFFVRIEGDVIEKGDIREFSVLSRSLEAPEAEFSLRFENKGNVHIQPRGNIRIKNMWGKERGVIPINNDSHFGNVLPGSIRDFRFTWEGERSLADIGRYEAEVALAYGQDESQSAVAVTHFWIIPIRGALITLGILVTIILAVTWMIRLYIRHMLILAGIDPDARTEKSTSVKTPETAKRTSILSPLKEGALELTHRFRDVHRLIDVVVTLIGFMKHYWRFFAAVIALILIFITLVHYIERVTTTDTSYEVGIQHGDYVETLTDEDILGPK